MSVFSFRGGTLDLNGAPSTLAPLSTVAGSKQAVLRFSTELDIHAARPDVRGVSVRATEVGGGVGWLSYSRFRRLLILGFQPVGLFCCFLECCESRNKFGIVVERDWLINSCQKVSFEERQDEATPSRLKCVPSHILILL